mgnify:CR=1 FL=1
MHQALQKNLYLVKEHVGLFKAANNFDIHDAERGAVVLECREPNLGFITKLLRFTDYKRMTPFEIHINTPEGERLLTIRRGWTLLRSKVVVEDSNGTPVGYFLQKLISIGGSFRVFDMNDKELCQLTGKWTSWEFTFRMGDMELAKVSKKWAGLGKELFTSADNYVLQINNAIQPDNPVRQMILAAVMCIDMVLKE